jgi:hypothetical protein
MPGKPQEKAQALLRELGGDRVGGLLELVPRKAATAIASALPDLPNQVAHDIAFHMTDWNLDAAFIAAVLLFPDRFSSDEIREGLRDFLIHAPNHVVAAAKLGGWPVTDVFKLNALDGVSVDSEAV